MSHGGGVELPETHGDHPSDPFTKKVALCVAIYAVILAVAGTGGKNAGKDMLSAQIKGSEAVTEETNAWNHFQAKSHREAAYKGEKVQLMISKSRPGLTPADNKIIDDRLTFLNTKLEDYVKDKTDIDSVARGFQQKHKDAKQEHVVSHKKDGYFDYAELLLQLSIVLSSVTMLSGARWPFLVSLVLVAVGLLFTLNGFFTFMHLSFIEGGAH